MTTSERRRPNELTTDRCVFCDAPIREQQSLAVHLETCEAVP